MAEPRTTCFSVVPPHLVDSGELTALPLQAQGEPGNHLRSTKGGGIGFETIGWYEVLLTVRWDAADVGGSRFAHTKVPGQQPLHSEAIDARVLDRVSQGSQLLRGNALFGPGWAEEIVLEVWHDSGGAIAILNASLTVRELAVPWKHRARDGELSA